VNFTTHARHTQTNTLDSLTLSKLLKEMLAQMISLDASVQKLWGTQEEQEMKEMEKGNIERFLEVIFFS